MKHIKNRKNSGHFFVLNFNNFKKIIILIIILTLCICACNSGDKNDKDFSIVKRMVDSGDSNDYNKYVKIYIDEIEITDSERNKYDSSINYNFRFENVSDEIIEVSYTLYPSEIVQKFMPLRSFFSDPSNPVELVPNQNWLVTVPFVINDIKNILSEEEVELLQNNKDDIYFALKINDKEYYIKINQNETQGTEYENEKLIEIIENNIPEILNPEVLDFSKNRFFYEDKNSSEILEMYSKELINYGWTQLYPQEEINNKIFFEKIIDDSLFKISMLGIDVDVDTKSYDKGCHIIIREIK